jgi:hypothetical protein
MVDGFLDIPWGVFIFLLVAVGGLAWTLADKDLHAGDYLTAVSGGAGLLAVGHGIRQHGNRPTDPPSQSGAQSKVGIPRDHPTDT